MNFKKEDKIISDKLNEYIEFDSLDKQKVWNRIEEELLNRKEKKYPLFRYVSIAALLIFFIGIYYATIETENNFQKGITKERLVKIEPNSKQAVTPSVNLNPFPKEVQKNKDEIVEQAANKHSNIPKITSIVSTKLTSIDIQEPIDENINPVLMSEKDASTNSFSNTLNINAPLAIVNSKNTVPKRKYSIVHINELGRSDEVNYFYSTKENEKYLNASYQQSSISEQQEAQKYLTIKIFINKSSNSLNNNYEK
jgi:hypothetical protein